MAARWSVAVQTRLNGPVNVVRADINRPDEQMHPSEQDAESCSAHHGQGKQD